MKNYNFAEMLSFFFTNYLSIQKNASNETIKSYKITFKLFIKYLIKTLNINIKDISFEYINRNNVINFLNYIEKDLNLSIKTRNQRLAAIKSFCRFVSYENIDYLNNIQQILMIPLKKGDNKIIDYLTNLWYNKYCE